MAGPGAGDPAPGPAAGTGPGSRHRYREEARECAPTSGKYVSPWGSGGSRNREVPPVGPSPYMMRIRTWS